LISLASVADSFNKIKKNYYMKKNLYGKNDHCSFEKNKDCDLKNHYFSLFIDKDMSDLRNNKKINDTCDIENITDKKRGIASLFDCSQVTSDFFFSTGYSPINHKSKRKIKIAVIDTGIDSSNPYLKNKIYIPKEYKNEYNFSGIDLVSRNFFPKDLNGHGSHVSGIILSMIPDAEILPISYYPENSENIKVIDMAKAIMLAVKSGVDIINISGGGYLFDSEEKESIAMARKSGIIVVGALGNDGEYLGENNRYYPASYNLDNIVTVGSVNKDGMKSKFSNFGISSVSAIGENVSSFSSKGDSCGVKMSGTSQSTAIISGVLAIILASSDSRLDYKQAKRALMRYTDFKKTIDDDNFLYYDNVINMNRLQEGVLNE
jgi:subtilisin family serine protease